MTPPDRTERETGAVFAPQFDAAGLIPAVVQDATTAQVLMVAWMNREALDLTVETGQAWYWSRSRQSLWRKGETSGHTQDVISLAIDCDQDTILLRVIQRGPACHTGHPSCFYRELDLGTGRLVDV